MVVSDLADVTVTGPHAGGPRRLSQLPDALGIWEELAERLAAAPLAVLLDFDGTLSPIVDDPGAAQLLPGVRPTLEQLAKRCPVTAVVSGRDLGDVRQRVGVDGLWYAGSHGFELAGPEGEHHEHEAARGAVPALDSAEAELRRRLAGVPGAVVDRKRFALAAHYRMVPAHRTAEVTGAVEAVAARHPGLRMTGGRCVSELRPDLDWDKGRALRWLLQRIGLDGNAALPVYAGDDLTDEDALAVVREEGLGIVVRSPEHGDRLSAAHVAVDGPEELARLLGMIAGLLARRAPH